MSKREIIIGILLFIVIVGGPAFVLLKPGPSKVNDTHTTTSSKSSQVSKKPSFDKNKRSIDDPTSIWVVVNKTRPLSPKDFRPNDLVSIGNGQLMREEPADALSKLITDAKLANLKITPLSGFRSYDTQVSVYSNEVKSFGQAVADTESARPGTSEHQTGLTVDVGGGGCGIEDCFGSTPEGKWVAQNAYKYGFIIRYPEGKQSTTGYRYEPWHLRFVGTDLANEMHSQNILTLEEFFGLPQAPQYIQN